MLNVCEVIAPRQHVRLIATISRCNKKKKKPTSIGVTENATVSNWCQITVTRYSVYIPVLHFIILWRLPAFVSPEQFGKRRGGNASANRGNKIPARISITSPSFCPSISSQNRTLFTSTPIIRSRRTPACRPPPHASHSKSENHMSSVSFFFNDFRGLQQTASLVKKKKAQVRQSLCVLIIKRSS